MSEHFAHVNSINIWYETFGNSKNPALLLMMGNSCDATMWPHDFCEHLANNGLYVIRFDQRDTGLSTWFDFKQTPYTLFDMVNDAIGLLDVLAIEKAHILGFSTGGAIAQLLAFHHPDRVLSLILMMTAMDLTIKNDAFAGKDMSNAAFPPPTQEFIKGVLAVNAHQAHNMHEKILQLVENFRLANGNKARYDNTYFYKLFETSLNRIKNRKDKQSLGGHTSNHALATSATPPLTAQELARITAPTLIIAGTEDPIFPLAHAQGMAKILPHAYLLTIDQMGHTLNPIFFEEIVSAITRHTIKK